MNPLIGTAKSTFVCNAEEIERSVMYSLLMCSFEGAYAWLDVAMGVCKPVNWSPVCSEGQILNTLKTLPPKNTQGKIYIGSIGKEGEEGTKVEAEFVNWDSQISAHAMVSVIDEVGLTVCILILKGKIVRRSLYVHGKILTSVSEVPSYLTEVTVVHAMRVMHDWIQGNPAGLYGVTNAAVHAGEYQLCKDIAGWFNRGTLGMQSSAAPLFINDMSGLDKWLQIPLAILPL